MKKCTRKWKKEGKSNFKENKTSMQEWDLRCRIRERRENSKRTNKEDLKRRKLLREKRMPSTDRS